MVNGVKSAKELIIAITALALTLGFSFKKPDEPDAKVGYEELSTAVKSNSEAIAKMHDDIVALHSYVDGLHGIPMVKYGAAPSASVATTSMASSSSDPVPVRVRPLGSSSAVPPSSAKPVVALPEPPGPRPPIFQPRGFGNAPKK